MGYRHSGPLPTALGDFKYAAVTVEYFSKWIEAKALRDITAAVGYHY